MRPFSYRAYHPKKSENSKTLFRNQIDVPVLVRGFTSRRNKRMGASTSRTVVRLACDVCKRYSLALSSAVVAVFAFARIAQTVLMTDTISV